MNVSVDTTLKKITLTFTDGEWDILVWTRQIHGPGIFQELMKNWLRSHWQVREQARLAALSNPLPTELE